MNRLSNSERFRRFLCGWTDGRNAVTVSTTIRWWALTTYVRYNTYYGEWFVEVYLRLSGTHEQTTAFDPMARSRFFFQTSAFHTNHHSLTSSYLLELHYISFPFWIPFYRLESIVGHRLWLNQTTNPEPLVWLVFWHYREPLKNTKHVWKLSDAVRFR